MRPPSLPPQDLTRECGVFFNKPKSPCFCKGFSDSIRRLSHREIVIGRLKIASLMVMIRAVHVTMRQLFARRRPKRGDFHSKVQRFAGQGMIEIEQHTATVSSAPVTG